MQKTPRQLLIGIFAGSTMDSATNLANEAHRVDPHLTDVRARRTAGTRRGAAAAPLVRLAATRHAWPADPVDPAAAYGWIPGGLAVLVLAQLGYISVSAGVHALAVGASGSLIIGRVTRTARCHTGRPLAVSKAEVAAMRWCWCWCWCWRPPCH